MKITALLVTIATSKSAKNIFFKQFICNQRLFSDKMTGIARFLIGPIFRAYLGNTLYTYNANT